VTGGIRGYGNSEATCVLEQLVDYVAKEIGMDPIQLRLKNIKRVGDLTIRDFPWKPALSRS
jgi:CO/xanthine dehydrogenase Mo-binding subunit